MAGENFKPEQAQIAGLEQTAVEKHAEELQKTLQQQHNVFFQQLDDVATIDVASLPEPARVEIGEDMKKIHQLTLSAAEKGQQILAQEKEKTNCQPVIAIAAELRSVIREMKAIIPVYQNIEKANAGLKALGSDIRDTLKIRDQFKNTMSAAEKDETTAYVLKKLYKAKEPIAEYAGLQISNPVIKKFYDDVNGRIDSAIVQISDLNLDNLPEKKQKQPEVKTLNTLRKSYDDFNANRPYELKSEVMKEVETNPNISDKIQQMATAADEVFQKMLDLQKQLISIDKSKLPTEYQGYHNIMVRKIGEKIKDMGDIKVYAATREYAKSNKYLIFNADGTVKTTPEFDKLPAEKQMEIKAKLKEPQMKVALEIDEKLASPEEKKVVEGKKQLFAGNWIEAKQSLLSYYKAQINKPGQEKNPRMAETKELMKQIAKMELLQSTSRLVAMKESIQGRFDNIPFAEKDYGTNSKDQAYMFIDDMARVLVKANELVDSGQALTLEEAEKTLRSLKPKGQPDEFQNSLKRFQMGFPMNFRGKRADDVFDTFKQQKLLNEPNTEKRQKNILDLAKKARERGLTDLAMQYYDLYFEKELKEKAKKYDKAETYQNFIEDKNKTQKIDENVAKWQGKFKSENGKEPTAAEVQQMRQYMIDKMVSLEHRRKLQMDVHKEFENQNLGKGAVWNETYRGKIALEDLGGSLLSDADWNVLPTMTAVYASIVFVSVNTGGAAATGLEALGEAMSLSGAVGMAEAGILTEETVVSGGLKTFLETTAGKAVTLGLESNVFTLTEGVLHGTMLHDWSILQSGGDFVLSWAQTALIYSAHAGIKALAPTVKLGGEIAKKGLETAINSGINTGAEWITQHSIKTSDVVKAHGQGIIFAVF